MSQPDERDRRIQELEERLSRLSEASLRINESLDFETVLQNALDSARDLTGARYGVIATVDEQGGLETILTSGTSEEEHQQVVALEGDGDVRPMRTIVSKLRRKLGEDADNPRYIFTEPRVGFRMPRGKAPDGEA